MPTDSTDAPKEDITILETVVFVNPFETDLKAYYDEKKEKETGALSLLAFLAQKYKY